MNCKGKKCSQMLIVSIYIVGSFLTPTFKPTKYMKSKNPSSMRTDFLSGLSKKDVFANFYGSFEPKNIKALHSIIDSFFHVFFCSYLYTIHDFHFYSISISSIKPKIQTFHLSSKSSDYLSLSKDYKKDILRFPRQDITFVNRKVSSNSEPLLGRFGLDE